MTHPFQRPKYKYGNCPIQEAIIEVRFSPNNWDSTVVGSIYERISKLFPIKREIQRLVLQVGKEPPAGPPQVPFMQFWNQAESMLVQIGPGLVTANCVRYESWESFLPALNSIGKAYVELVNPERVSRISTRYINRFMFEGSPVDLSDYFNLDFSVPKELGALTGFEFTFASKMPLAVVQGDQEVRVTFQTEVASPESENAAIILDVLGGTTIGIPPGKTPIERIATELHDSVENIFEGFITDGMRKRLGGKTE